MTNEPIIEARSLRRDFKKTHAVDGLDLSIDRGELFGIVGPDGAGKTTSLRLLAGLLQVSGGEATILGYDLQHEAERIKPHVGYMAQQFSLYTELSVLENLQFFAELFDVSPQDYAERTRHLLTFAGLLEFKDRRAVYLSGGMQKKLALACTLIHQPDILLLDEPTTGVDPISRREFWNILTDLHIEGTTILVSTPYMDEADRCSRVALMYGGRIIECSNPQQIRGKLEGKLIELRPDDWQSAMQLVRQIEGVNEVETYGKSLHILVDSGQRRLPEIESAMIEAQIGYRSIRLAPAKMEDAFVSLIRKLEG